MRGGQIVPLPDSAQTPMSLRHATDDENARSASARLPVTPKVDMIIRNARVLTFDSANRVLDSGAVEILPDGSIGQVGDTPAGDRRGTPWRAPTLVRSSDKNEESTASRTPQPSPPHHPLIPSLARREVQHTRKLSTRRASF